MYTASGTLDKEQLVVQYAPLVKRIAYHLMAKLPASVQVLRIEALQVPGLDAERCIVWMRPAPSPTPA